MVADDGESEHGLAIREIQGTWNNGERIGARVKSTKRRLDLGQGRIGIGYFALTDYINQVPVTGREGTVHGRWKFDRLIFSGGHIVDEDIVLSYVGDKRLSSPEDVQLTVHDLPMSPIPRLREYSNFDKLSGGLIVFVDLVCIRSGGIWPGKKEISSEEKHIVVDDR